MKKLRQKAVEQICYKQLDEAHIPRTDWSEIRIDFI
jgi:hypothetical protein